jgi:hypothetical protein
VKPPKLCLRCGKRPRVKYRQWCDVCQAHSNLAEAIAIFLSTIGWKAILIGEVKIQSPPGEQRHFNYEFVVRFTGKDLKPASASEPQNHNLKKQNNSGSRGDEDKAR